MAHSISEATQLATDWLSGEHALRAKEDRMLHGYATNSSYLIRAIMNVTLPEMWEAFRQTRNIELRTAENKQELGMYAGQLIMKACSHAQSAVEWKRRDNGVPDSIVVGQTWSDLEHRYASYIQPGARRLPHSEELADDYTVAIDEYVVGQQSFTEKEVLATFLRLSDLAVAHILDQDDRNKYLALPRPGVPLGLIEEWQR